MSEHTLGPWHREHLRIYALEKGDRLLAEVALEFPARWTCRLEPGPNIPEEELLANARLMEFAPQLYSTVLAMLLAWPVPGDSPEQSDVRRVAEELLERVRGYRGEAPK